MNDPTRIEATYGLPEWVRRAAGSRLGAVGAAQAKLDEARADLDTLVQHVRLICGDEGALAWFLAIGVSKATLRRFWKRPRRKERARTPEWARRP
jgi:hypothetical protein